MITAFKIFEGNYWEPSNGDCFVTVLTDGYIRVLTLHRVPDTFENKKRMGGRLGTETVQTMYGMNDGKPYLLQAHHVPGSVSIEDVVGDCLEITNDDFQEFLKELRATLEASEKENHNFYPDRIRAAATPRFMEMLMGFNDAYTTMLIEEGGADYIKSKDFAVFASPEQKAEYPEAGLDFEFFDVKNESIADKMFKRFVDLNPGDIVKIRGKNMAYVEEHFFEGKWTVMPMIKFDSGNSVLPQIHERHRLVLTERRDDYIERMLKEDPNFPVSDYFRKFANDEQKARYPEAGHDFDFFGAVKEGKGNKRIFSDCTEVLEPGDWVTGNGGQVGFIENIEEDEINSLGEKGTYWVLWDNRVNLKNGHGRYDFAGSRNGVDRGYLTLKERRKDFIDRVAQEDHSFVITDYFRAFASPEQRFRYSEAGHDFGFFDAVKESLNESTYERGDIVMYVGTDGKKKCVVNKVYPDIGRYVLVPYKYADVMKFEENTYTYVQFVALESEIVLLEKKKDYVYRKNAEYRYFPMGYYFLSFTEPGEFDDVVNESLRLLGKPEFRLGDIVCWEKAKDSDKRRLFAIVDFFLIPDPEITERRYNYSISPFLKGMRLKGTHGEQDWDIHWDSIWATGDKLHLVRTREEQVEIYLKNAVTDTQYIKRFVTEEDKKKYPQAGIDFGFFDTKSK